MKLLHCPTCTSTRLSVVGTSNVTCGRCGAQFIIPGARLILLTEDAELERINAQVPNPVATLDAEYMEGDCPCVPPCNV